MLIYFSLSQTNGPEAPITLCILGDVCIRLPQKEQGCYSKCNVECGVRTRTAACAVTTMKERWWVFFEMIHLASECRLQKLFKLFIDISRWTDFTRGCNQGLWTQEESTVFIHRILAYSIQFGLCSLFSFIHSKPPSSAVWIERLKKKTETWGMLIFTLSPWAKTFWQIYFILQLCGLT